MQAVRKLIAILTPRERRNGLIVLFFAVISSLFEVIGIASVLPFLGVLTNPSAIAENATLSWLYERLGFTSSYEFLKFLGGVTFAIIILSALARAASYYLLTRYVQMRRHSIGLRLLESYLRQPYAFFLGRHSGDIVKTILSEMEYVIGSVLQPLAVMVANGFTLLAILAFLLLIDPWVVLTMGFVVGGAYALLYRKLSGYFAKLGKERARINQARFQTISETIGGIKDIKLLGHERSALGRFEAPSYQTSTHLTSSMVLGEVPRYAIEAVAFGGILLLSLILLMRSGGHDTNALGTVIPMLGVYAFAGYRMLPAIQGIYRSLSTFRFGGGALEQVHKDLQQLGTLPPLQKSPSAPLPLAHTITFNGLHYRYPNAEKDGLSDINLTIKRGSLVGVVGSTGAGKTTLVDVLLGLLEPTKGHLCIDDTVLGDANLRAWQKNIGYVPQDIFLMDSSIRENIAFGIAKHEIDDTKVRTAAKLAHIDSFIQSELAQGYDTLVGERGVRISGGQKQRIGIARALYHNPEVIVFDEATSALDNLTEKQVMDAINTLSSSKTILLIAHRLSTVEPCDQIIVLDKGTVSASGTYNELAKGNAIFKSLLQQSES